MEEHVLDAETLPLERKSLLPGRGFFVPDDVREAQADQEARERAATADVIVVADGDADGLGATAVIAEVFDDEEVALLTASPHNLEDGLRRAAEYGPEDAHVFVCDLCPDEYRYVEEELELLVDHAGDVQWFDHHQWSDEAAAAVREAGVDLVVGDSDEECTADVALRALDAEHDLPRHIVELAAVTRDHDLWIKEDPRSDDLADYSRWVDAEEYLDVVREHGPDLPETAREFLAERREEKEALIEKAVERASIKEVNGVTVGVTYGRCSQNEVAEELRQRGADAAVVVKPAGSASIRGSEDFERCHEVADQVNGGGHPRAAGCKPRIYDDMMDYAHHWTTQGAVTKQVILDGFRNLPETEESEEAAESEEETDEESEE
ncbi:DHH family phosphoesterase [Halospeciosus flavus]|uniref:DHH family phosphoesterase n=1 Tax=Halospeciosus flavus TaxID=3032283 RepID=A0ABD5Z6U2_9EURY|nr:phosphohydrolase [Halospeciosus flavus]